MTLGDYGADVIKVESLAGDTVRGIGPMVNANMGHVFLHLNRNKRSVALNLKQPDALAALLKLIETADVLLYNIRPQAMERLGLGYERLAALNPGLIYCGVFGYGQTGPYAANPAYDDLIQGLAAVPTLNALVSDGQPRFVPLSFVDRSVGLAAVGAVCAALFARERQARLGQTTKGQRIDVPMFETMLSYVLGEHMAGETFAPSRGTVGYPRQLSKFRRPFRTTDGYICALIYNDQHWLRYWRARGEPERMRSDPRLANITVRTQHIDALYQELADYLATQSCAHWLQFFQAADIPVVRLHSLESLLDDPHVQSVQALRWRAHPSEGPLRSIEPAGTWSSTPPSVRRLAPALGEHTVEVLSEIGISPQQIQALISQGAARAHLAT
jgi:crotonobetainyl-CoA:carnitine CoA-transferase CaiB-like acyl-CoA transferase